LPFPHPFYPDGVVIDVRHVLLAKFVLRRVLDSI
jgi:hypothetical protein